MDRFDGTRIYFSPCGLGLGHVGRCYPIAEDLNQRGADILFSTYHEGFDFVKNIGFPVVLSPAMGLVTDSKGSIDIRMSSVKEGLPALPRFLRQMNVEIEYMKAYRPDLVISDTRLSSVLAANLLGLPTILLLNQFQPIVPRSSRNFKLSKIADGLLMTLIGRSWAASDLILIPDFPEPCTISLESLRIPKPYRRIVRLVGSILPIKPDEINASDRIRAEVGAGADKKLIFAPISGPSKERLPLIPELESIFKEFTDDYKIVMSMGLPKGGSKPTSTGSLTTFPWIKNRFEYLKACDLVISRAGHETIMQSICYGKPQILIPTPGHTEQYGNARRAKELGVSEAIHQRELNIRSLSTLVKEVLGKNCYLQRLKLINSKNNLGDGVKNVVDAIGEFLPR